MHAIYLHIGDFNQDCARFSPLQIGVYMRLLFEYYKSEKALQNDFENLCWLCGAQFKNEIEAVRFVLLKCFTLDEGKQVWVQKRCDEEIAIYAAHGVQARYAILCRHWDKANKGHPKPSFDAFAENPNSYFDRVTGRIRIITNRKPLVFESYSDSDANLPEPNYKPVNHEPVNHEPVNQGITPVVPKGTKSGPDEAALAEAIYLLYPRKQGRKKALSAITKALKTAGLTELELQAKVREFAAAVSRWPDDQKQFIPMPATWFNQGRWEDDPSTWTRSDPTASANPRFGEKKEEGGGLGMQIRGQYGGTAEAPDNWEEAMAPLLGEDWRDFMQRAFSQLTPSDQAAVRRFLVEKNEGGADA